MQPFAGRPAGPVRFHSPPGSETDELGAGVGVGVDRQLFQLLFHFQQFMQHELHITDWRDVLTHFFLQKAKRLCLFGCCEARSLKSIGNFRSVG